MRKAGDYYIPFPREKLNICAYFITSLFQTEKLDKNKTYKQDRKSMQLKTELQQEMVQFCSLTIVLKIYP